MAGSKIHFSTCKTRDRTMSKVEDLAKSENYRKLKQQKPAKKERL